MYLKIPLSIINGLIYILLKIYIAVVVKPLHCALDNDTHLRYLLLIDDCNCTSTQNNSRNSMK